MQTDNIRSEDQRPRNLDLCPQQRAQSGDGEAGGGAPGAGHWGHGSGESGHVVRGQLSAEVCGHQHLATTSDDLEPGY